MTDDSSSKRSFSSRLLATGSSMRLGSLGISGERLSWSGPKMPSARMSMNALTTGVFSAMDSLTPGKKKRASSKPSSTLGSGEASTSWSWSRSPPLMEEPPEEEEDKRSLLEQVGGREALKATVEVFYERLIKDPKLAPFFEHVPLAKLKMHQVRFFCMALGGSSPGMITGFNTYQATGMGNSSSGVDISEVDPKILYLVEKHERLFRAPHLALTEEHFDLVANYFYDTLAKDFRHSRTLVKKVVAILEPCREAFALGAKLYGPNASSATPLSSDSDDRVADDDDKTDTKLQEISAKLGKEDNDHAQAQAIICELSGQLTKDQQLSPYFANMDLRAMRHHQLMMLHVLLCSPPSFSGGRSDPHTRRNLMANGGALTDSEAEDEDDDSHSDEFDQDGSSSNNMSSRRHFHVELARQHANLIAKGGFSVQQFDRFTTLVTDALLFMQVDSFLVVEAEEVLLSYRHVFVPRKNDD